MRAGGATVARTRRPLPRKAAVAADMVWCLRLTRSRHSSRCWVASNRATTLVRCNRIGSLGLDPQLLDDRPPSLGVGLHKRAECLRGLSLARENLQSEIDEPRSHHRIS